MAQTQVNGGTQIQAGTITKTQTDSSLIAADGSRAFTAEVAGVDPTSATHLATKAYVDAVANGLSIKASVMAATTGAESFTISGGSVTQISGTTVDGVSTLAVGDRVLVKNAPSASGTGTADSNNTGTDQPANGIYSVTGNTTNLSLSRVADMSGTVKPTGAFVFIEAGTANKGAGYTVIDPTADSGAFTYGSSNVQWTKFSQAGAGVTTVSVVSANGFGGSVANPGTTPAITLTTSVSGLLKGNGTAISAATAGTDYMAPSDFVVRETPSGTINGSNTSFTLAHTPLSGTEELYLNGILQDSGAGNDYTISSGTITMLSAPLSGDKLRCSYQK